jgi:hypothetical protein
MWISPVADEDASGLLRELYDQDLQGNGYVSNTTRAWSQRPELLPLWQQLLKGIRSHLRLRAYELVTLASSRAIGCVF